MIYDDRPVAAGLAVKTWMSDFVPNLKAMAGMLTLARL